MKKERKLYTREELNELKAWFDSRIASFPNELQLDKATYIPDLLDTIDRLWEQAEDCFENPKMQGSVILLEKIKDLMEKDHAG